MVVKMKMKTYNSIGFISYNSYEFLKNTLQSLVDGGLFSRCACWFHESLGTEKDHFHCWVEPAKIIEDTNTLKEFFIELDEEGNQNSIAIRPRCGSKWIDAYLYGIHDNDYLKFKGLERELVNIVSDKHIYIGDFKSDIQQAVFYRFKCCLSPYERIKELVWDNRTLEEVYIILRTPFSQFASVSIAYRQCLNDLNRYKTEHPDLFTEELNFKDKKLKKKRGS